MAREPRDHQFAVRIPSRIFALVEEQADRERRTAADVLNNLLDDYYAGNLVHAKGRGC